MKLSMVALLRFWAEHNNDSETVATRSLELMLSTQ